MTLFFDLSLQQRNSDLQKWESSGRKRQGGRQEFYFVHGKFEVPSDMQGKYKVTAYTCLKFKGKAAVRDLEIS